MSILCSNDCCKIQHFSSRISMCQNSGIFIANSEVINSCSTNKENKKTPKKQANMNEKTAALTSTPLELLRYHHNMCP